MALIYANAVNKRMGLHSDRRKKSEITYRACSPCPYGNHHKYSVEERPRKKSSTAESGILSDLSSTVHSSHSTSPVRAGEHHHHHKRNVVRSKTTTTCCDLSRGGELSRKRSTPVFGNSHSCTREREEMRCHLTKKQLQKSEMSCSSLQTPAVSSLDEEEEESTTSQFFEDNKEDATMERKGSVFSRMKRKFSNWKI
ncbi:hypothetical protein PRIPAC_96836 [Pristionchus pacificus]|uniref:Uncharacterized protein n=1 Tax=Pristionchus pacificus TaxID=54126 RepID=A0A2A6BDC4_PRIPA|nr:hypothetical protein PRIPAC_96836 [Pristionchus pacificus]|eukprot:PDM63874.1 hypothetical protein PRIPAC_49847 [Pristionchus pacificus]